MQTKTKKCQCRQPRTDGACAYCGYLPSNGKVCGRCHDMGVDGGVIRGTERRRCAEVKRAIEIRGWFANQLSALVDDPMTEAYGAPVDDFARDWSNQHRKMIADALETMTCPNALEMLFAALDPYLP